jgi:hypothetical protein
MAQSRIWSTPVVISVWTIKAMPNTVIIAAFEWLYYR